MDMDVCSFEIKTGFKETTIDGLKRDALLCRHCLFEQSVGEIFPAQTLFLC